MTTVKNIFKITGFIILIILVVIILFLTFVFANNVIKREKDIDFLQEEGFVNLVRAKNYELNAVTFGKSDNPKHRIVCLAGLNCHDFPLTAKKMTDLIEGDQQIIFLDRAGYGISDDTKRKMTVESIVENYRKALENAGTEAPYIIMAHSISGAYATYWESKYPDEIEAVIFLDGTPLREGDAFDNPEFTEYDSTSDKVNVIACNIGLQRLAVRKFFLPLAETYTPREQSISDALNVHNGFSNAIISETTLANDNCAEAYKNIKTNSIPKLYIDASLSVSTEEDVLSRQSWVNDIYAKAGLPIAELPHSADRIIDDAKADKEEILMPYLEKLGNCDYAPLPGFTKIYEQRPEDCAEIINGFIKKLDN